MKLTARPLCPGSVDLRLSRRASRPDRWRATGGFHQMWKL